MNALQASIKISELESQINSLETILPKIAEDSNLLYEYDVVRNLKYQLEETKRSLEGKLKSLDV